MDAVLTTVDLPFLAFDPQLGRAVSFATWDELVREGYRLVDPRVLVEAREGLLNVPVRLPNYVHAVYVVGHFYRAFSERSVAEEFARRLPTGEVLSHPMYESPERC